MNLHLGIVTPSVVAGGPHPALPDRQTTADTTYTVSGDKPPIQQLRGSDSAFTVQLCLEDPAVAFALYSTISGWPGTADISTIKPNSR